MECELSLCSVGLGETEGKGTHLHKELEAHGAELTEVCR